MKEPCLVTFCGVWFCLLALSPRTTPLHGVLSFEPFFARFVMVLEKKTKSIKFYTKFYVKQITILWLSSTSL